MHELGMVFEMAKVIEEALRMKTWRPWIPW